jgi:hypothetical protein
MDVLHTNAVEFLPRGLPGVHDGAAVLLCSRELDLVYLVDLASPEPRVVWEWGRGELDRPHAPSLLASGNILVLDNGKHRGWTRAIEVDVRTRAKVWEYKGTPPETFFTAQEGFAQRLPNGNTLLTESAEGRVFEVTRNGDTVWEFFVEAPQGFPDSASSVYQAQKLDPNAPGLVAKLKNSPFGTQ